MHLPSLFDIFKSFSGGMVAKSEPKFSKALSSVQYSLLTIKHFWGHPVWVPHHRVAFLTVNASKQFYSFLPYSFFIGWFVGGWLFDLILHD